MNRVNRAFTLIELLVVIAIIAILAAILFPVFAQARERARQISCMSNSKQLATASYMYVQDFDETLMPATNYATPTDVPSRIWPAAMAGYVKNEGVYACPSAVNVQFAANWALRGWSPIGYNAMTSFDPAGVEAPTSVASLALLDESARTVLFAETPSGPTVDKYRGYVFDPTLGKQNAADPRLSTPLTADIDLVAGSSLGAPLLKPVYCRHFRTGTGMGTANLVFADSHAKAHSANSILGQQNGANLIWKFR